MGDERQRPAGAFPADPDYLRRKVPPRQATIHGAVGAPVEIRWDTWGIPHIRARSRPDLFFGLGYAVAQECLWRLDYCRRQARGQLAAILGRDALPSDRAMRILGLGAHADRLAERLPVLEAEVLEAYAAGVNRWIDEALSTGRLHVEFDWLGYRPEPWRPADSIACWKYRWWGLTSRLENIAIAEVARRVLPPALLEAFLEIELGEETILPGDERASGGAPGTASDGEGEEQWAQEAERASGGAPGTASDGEGSNNWAVAGRRTTTGYPVLCSDPHNAFSQPGQWFEAQLTLADGSLDVAGATYAGWPGVYLGRNRQIAWGFTNHVAPVRDLYVETVDSARPAYYRERGAWVPFQVEEEVIEVRDAPPERFEVRRTVRGPIVDSLLPSFLAALGGRGGPVSLRWIGLEVGTGLEALLALNAARSVEEALDALARWLCPPLNGLVAGQAGRIAYHVAGQIPRRATARRGFRRADDPADAWQGMLDFHQLPQLADPPRGWLATANQPPWRHDPPGMAYVAGGAWADGWRGRRIRQRLEAHAPQSPDELGSIQADVASGRAIELVPRLLALMEGAGRVEPALARACDLLRSWDGAFGLDSAAPTVWTAFWELWTRRVAAARLPATVAPPPVLGSLGSPAAATQAGAVARRLLLGDDTDPPWFGERSIAVEAAETLALAVEWLQQRFGPHAEQWQWGRAHTVTFTHPLAEAGPPHRREAARRLFNVGPFPTSGGQSIVRAAAYSVVEPFQVVSGATYRLVADLSPSGGIVTTSTTGQSGHPGSPHYADQASLWLEDRYHPLPLDDFESEGVTTIVPATPRA